MTGEAKVTKWVSPETERKATQVARDRAQAARWDLDVAIFLFIVLIIVITLLFQKVGTGIVASAALFGLTMVWVVGWRRGRQLYRRFYVEELAGYPDDWKNYYKILRISPGAETETVTGAHERLVHVYRDALSDKAKRIPLYSLMLKEVDEAYQVLSDPARRTAYDRIFWLKYNIEHTEIEESVKGELIDFATSIAQVVQSGKRRIGRRIPGWDKATRRAVLAVAMALFVVLFGGTSLAFAKPEHTLATPFRWIAITLTEASAGAIGLIEDVRGIAALHERKIISTALQSMRVEEHLTRIPAVTVSTNDMASFPSPEHSLFPDYLDNRLSQFKYTVDSKGTVTVDTSWATTDAFLDKIKLMLGRLEQGGN